MAGKRILLVGLIAVCAATAAKIEKDRVPLFFVANHGQAAAGVSYVAKGSGLTAYFSPGEAVFRLAGTSIRVSLEGSDPKGRVEGMGRLPGQANFLLGAPENWHLAVPTYGKVVYRNVYPGIDMAYGSSGRDLKSEFIVAPGSDPGRIRIRYGGAGYVRVADNGELVIPLDGSELREQAPVLYQERDGERVAVDGRFFVADNGAVGFIVGEYDSALPLIIDPVLSYSTLLGGSGFDSGTALAVDSSGSAYVAGFTDSYDLPKANPEQNFNAGGNDVFVAKLNPSGNVLLYCTYLGGQGDDRAYGIAVDANGSAYVTGSTTSTNFPVRNAIQGKLAGGRNAFVVKLSAAGNALVYGTYLGGNISDTGYGVAVDASGNAYVVGDTTSLNFPATGFQRGTHGGQDAFVSKISADGSRIVYSTYLGGSNTDHGSAIAVDYAGNAYVTGSTWSTNFPVANAFQVANAGGQDAFLTRLRSDGNTLVYSTYLGGTGGTVAYPESGQGIALDDPGNAYVAGVTSSLDFPTLHALQPGRRGSTDAFLTKVNPAGAMVYSTYLGGSGVDIGNAIAVDAVGAAYVGGYTYSTDLPVMNALQNSVAGDCDAFLAKVSPAGDALAYLSYLGGNGADTATGLALDPVGSIYVAGWTLSSNFPLLNPYQSTNSGNYGAFVSKLVINPPPANLGVTPSAGTSRAQTFSFQFSDQNGALDLTTVSALFNSTFATAGGCAVTYDRTRNALALLTDAGAQPPSTITPGSGSQQNSRCVLSGNGSSASSAGTLLTLNLMITFLPTVSGATNIYMQAASLAATTNWQRRGIWTVPAMPPTRVVFVRTDNATKGSWKGVYGADGAAIVNDSTNYPNYAQVAMAGQYAYTWAASTNDVRAVQKAAGSDRIASTWYSGANFTIDVNLIDGNTHQVAFYCLDWDNGRSEIIDVSDAVSGNRLDSRTVGSFLNGRYVVWNITGHVVFRVTATSRNPVVSGVFFGVAGPIPPPPSAAFIKTDSTTRGNWKGAYGTDGAGIVNDSTNYPSYAQVAPANQYPYSWAGSTSDVRALQKAAGSDRIAATWYSGNNFTIDVNLIDGITHQVALYCLDWDSGRAEVIDVSDAETGVKLDSRTVTNFVNGRYLVWNITGHVVFRVTATSFNPVVSGVFFGPASPPPPPPSATFLVTDTTTKGGWKGVYGADGAAIANDSTNYPGYAQVAMANQYPYTWVASTADVRAMQKAAASDRIASTWYAGTSFTIDLQITDGNTHQVALYCLDWETGRAEVIEVLDGVSGAVLDSRTVASFVNGKHLVWNIRGHVVFRITATSGNPVVNGVFFGGP